MRGTTHNQAWTWLLPAALWLAVGACKDEGAADDEGPVCTSAKCDALDGSGSGSDGGTSTGQMPEPTELDQACWDRLEDAKRVPSLPDVPTSAEAGLPNFEVTVWHGLYAPKGTPKPIVDQLSAALRVALKDPTVTQRFADLGTEPEPADRATPAAHRAHLKAEVEKWAPVIKKAGVYAD